MADLRLPIDSFLPDICAALETAGALVLQAEPGAGKTTRVPAALLDAGLAGSGSVLVLEPRRVAASAAADFVARERGERVGDTVGYQVRFERRGGARTRVWFATEGVAVRRLAADPFLDDVGVLVLDEFHERHLAGDIVLAIARELRATVRPDLRIVVMSATLDVDSVARFLGDCPVFRCSGRGHPVDIDYFDRPREERLADSVVAAVGESERRGGGSGDLLVFLPGRGEIARAADELNKAGLAARYDVLSLHGDLPLEAQRRVLQSVQPRQRLGRHSGRRRIVLSTNVAESSVTVSGVDVVIDSGLARIPELDTGKGVERLRLRPISVASADQRAGRAGRQSPGWCLRLWSRHDHAARRSLEVPEIRRLDLASVILDLRAWGLRDLDGFAWLDDPPAAAVERAEALLRDLGAVSSDDQVTEVGRGMMRLPASPRAARLLLEAQRLDCAAEGALFAALLSERDLRARPSGAAGASGYWRSSGPARSDLSLQAALFEEAAASGFAASVCRAIGVDAGAARAVDRARAQLSRAAVTARPAGESSGRRASAPPPSEGNGWAGAPGEAEADDPILRAVLAAFPDRVVRRRAPGTPRGLMVGGTGVRLADASAVREPEYFVAVDLRGDARQRLVENTVAVASGIEASWLAETFGDRIQETRELELDVSSGQVVSVRRRTYRGLVMAESRSAARDGTGADLVAGHVLSDPRRVLDLDAKVTKLMARIDFARANSSRADDLPDSEGLLERATAAACAGKDSVAQVRSVDLGALLRGMLNYQQQRLLDRLAPSSLRLPSGREATIDYARVGLPAASGRIQELFGLAVSPRLGDGGVALALEILGPNYRPVQVTDDLASFWSVTYPQVRKELRGRYPKHDWPEDPHTAVARTRPNRGRS